MWYFQFGFGNCIRTCNTLQNNDIKLFKYVTRLTQFRESAQRSSAINARCFYAVLMNDDDDDEDDDDAMGKSQMIEMIQFFYQISMLK